MTRGNPVELPCPYWPHGRRWRSKCSCEKCAECGFAKHMAIHGGVVGKPGFVFGHEFKRKSDAAGQPTLTKEKS